MSEYIMSNLDTLPGWVLLIFTVGSSLVEIAPVKWKPLSWICKKAGQAINGDVLEQMDKLRTELQALKQKMQNMEDKEAEDKAICWRNSILAFGDELLHDVRHSQERFDQVLEDIGDYEKYCSTHPNFKNRKTVATTRHILDTYQHLLETHDFL